MSSHAKSIRSFIFRACYLEIGNEMTETCVHLRNESYIEDAFEWGFAGQKREVDGNLVTYPIPDGQWSKFRTEFGISQFQRVNYYETAESTTEPLGQLASRVAVSDRSVPDNEKGMLRVAGAVQTDSRLYVLISRHFTVEGKNRDEIVSVAVFRPDTAIIAIRVNDDERAGGVYTLLRQILEWETERSESRKPSFDSEFRTEFSERLAEAYTQVWFEGENIGNVNTIHFQGSGDLRENEIVSEYFGEYKLYAGYVRIEADTDAKFYFNWPENRISFRGETAEGEIIEASDQIIRILNRETAPSPASV